MRLKVVGHAVPRLDATAKVTGRAQYTIDLAIPGMVAGRLLRSPYPHAQIQRIDTSAARAVPGVLAVLTSDDVQALERTGERFVDQPLLARGRVRYEGEPVAAVAAVDEVIADEALERIEVDYDPLTVVADLDAALARNAPLIHEDITGAGQKPPANVRPVPGTNILNTVTISHGDVDCALAAADLVVEGRYEYPAVHQYPMEPHVAIAEMTGSGVTIWSGTRRPFVVRQEVAARFGIALTDVRVVVPYVGGAYGSKSYAKLEPLAAALARACGRPVRLTASVAEGFRTIMGHEIHVTITSGVSREGTLLARRTRVHVDVGGYADSGTVGPRIAASTAFRSNGPYRIPHVDLQGCAVYTNRVPGGALRGYGAPQVAWAYEAHTDALARALEMDPVTFRQKNLLARGETSVPGAHPMDGDTHGVLRRAATRVPRVRNARRGGAGALIGRGVAIGAKMSAENRTLSEAAVRLDADGGVTVLTGGVESGQGAQTVFAQIAAEELRVPLDRVRVTLPDTIVAPFDQGTGSSGTTIAVGQAIRSAAEQVRAQLTALAADALSTSKQSIRFDQGVARAGRKEIPFGDLIKHAATAGGEVVGRGAFRAEAGRRATFWELSAVAVRVEVDPETGVITLIRLVSAADVGRAIHPQMVEGQEEGSLVMGLGPALFEAVTYEGGQMLNPGLLDYRVPLAQDLPHEATETVLIEKGDGPGPYGAKGVGESGILAIAPAIANALFSAAGVQVTALPLTPERVFWAMRKAKGEPL